MFTVKVIESSTGRPVEGARVCVGFEGPFRAFTEDEYTDEEGEAHFDNDNGRGTIFVDGDNCYEGRIEGRKVIYV
jgi:hypothetical protein